MAGTLDSRLLAVVAAFTVAASIAFLGLTGESSGDARAAKCPKANAGPGEANSEQLGEAALCLIGKERKQADRKPVGRVNTLSRVAAKHTKVMIKEDCLDHRCKGEKSLNDRIVNSGYPIPGGRYGFAEITGCAVTPQAMVDDWMDRKFHKRQILGEKYRDVGVGVDKGKIRKPGCGNGAQRGVYTVIFGWRKR